MLHIFFSDIFFSIQKNAHDPKAGANEAPLGWLQRDSGDQEIAAGFTADAVSWFVRMRADALGGGRAMKCH